MSAEQRIRVRRDGDLLRVTLDDAERANALSPRMIEEVTEVYRRDWLAEGVRAVILDAPGKNFSAGADLEHLRSLRDAGHEQNLADSRRLRDLFASVLRQPALTVALVQGACVAGGCGLATAHALASRDRLIFYTDGITEARNAAGDEYGDDRLAGDDAVTLMSLLVEDAGLVRAES